MSPLAYYNFQPPGPGNYTACVCAFDVAGGYVCSFASMRLDGLPSYDVLSILSWAPMLVPGFNATLARDSGSAANVGQVSLQTACIRLQAPSGCIDALQP